MWRSRILSLFAGISLLAFLSGCAAKKVVLVPAPNAALASAPKFNGATSEVDGVRIIAAANEWSGRPANLWKHVTPLLVRIENHSNHPLQISYDDFTLREPQGKTFADLPPAAIKGTTYVGDNFQHSIGGAQLVNTAFDPQRGDDASHVAAPAGRVYITPEFDYDDFYTAPYWDYGYTGLSPWSGVWAPDLGYYNTYYPYMRQIHLPTPSMLRKGIPEGVVNPGGHIAGFLYFSKVGDKAQQVNLVANLVDAKTQQKFGQITIPFEVKK